MDSLPNASLWDLRLLATPAPININYGFCDMVRGSYLAKLRETLMFNLSGNAMGDCVSTEDATVEMYVEKCLGEMEKNALRKCMVAEIYCEVMRKMVHVFCIYFVVPGIHPSVHTHYFTIMI